MTDEEHSLFSQPNLASAKFVNITAYDIEVRVVHVSSVHREVE